MKISGKVIIICLIYMIIVYTAVNVFTIDAYAYDEFNIGGNNNDLLEKSDIDWQVITVNIQNSQNLSGSEMFNYLNNTIGEYQGHYWIFNWLDSGWYHIFKNNKNEETKIQDWKFEKLMNGNLDVDDISFQEQAGSVLSNIWNGISYIFGLLTFDLVGTTMSDGNEIPTQIGIILTLMVLIPYIIIILWLLPYLISLLSAIGNLIPGT